jgi:predicted ferric reductase
LGGKRQILRGLSGTALLVLYLGIALGVLLFLLVHPFLYAVPRLSTDPMRAVAVIQRMFTIKQNGDFTHRIGEVPVGERALC